jgi:hypothetical protein
VGLAEVLKVDRGLFGGEHFDGPFVVVRHIQPQFTVSQLGRNVMGNTTWRHHELLQSVTIDHETSSFHC